jgi:hypothetical protein
MIKVNTAMSRKEDISFPCLDINVIEFPQRSATFRTTLKTQSGEKEDQQTIN